MTIKELITQLMAFDPEATVVIPDNEGPDEYDDRQWTSIKDVRYTETRFYDWPEDNRPSGYRTANVVRLEGF